MNQVTITGEKRTDFGKKITKTLRANGNVPCVVYGGSESIAFSASAKELKKIVYTDKFAVVEINLGGTTKKAIMKDLDFHPVTDNLLHVDFQELVEDRKVKVDIPVRITGFAEGVKAGGKLELNLRKITVKALPSQLVDEVEVDVTSLELGKSIKIRDLATDLEVVNPAGIPIARVIIPRAMRSAASKADADAGGTTATE